MAERAPSRPRRRKRHGETAAERGVVYGCLVLVLEVTDPSLLADEVEGSTAAGRLRFFRLPSLQAKSALLHRPHSQEAVMMALPMSVKEEEEEETH